MLTSRRLDALSFPHIIDRIVDLAPVASLLALRGVSKALKSAVDSRLNTHIVADFSSEAGPSEWRLSSHLGGALPVELTYRDLSIPYLPSAAERSPQSPSMPLAGVDASGDVGPQPQATPRPPEYTSRHYALTSAGGLCSPRVLSLSLHPYGDTRINVTFPPDFCVSTLRAHCGSGHVVVPNWTGYQEWPHIPGFPEAGRVVLFAEIGADTHWGVSLPYTGIVDASGTRIKTTRRPPPGGVVKVVNTLRLRADAGANAHSFDHCGLIRNVDPAARYEYVFVFDPEPPSEAALADAVRHEMGVLSCVLVSLDWNVAPHPVTLVGVDRIDPRLLGLPEGTGRAGMEDAVRRNVERRSAKQVDIARMLRADPSALEGFADRIRFLSHDEYRGEVGGEAYDLEARWELPTMVL